MRTLVVSIGAVLALVACQAEPSEPTTPEPGTQVSVGEGDTSLGSETGTPTLPDGAGGDSASTDTSSTIGLFEGTVAEYFQLKAQCLRDAGFAAEVTPTGDGIAVPNIVGEQRMALRDVSKRCGDQIGQLPEVEPMTPEQLLPFFEGLLEMRECLIARGYDIESAPTFSVYAESLNTDPWHPYMLLPDDLPEEEWNRLQTVCPQS